MEGRKRRQRAALPINNAFYNDLNDKWHEAKDHPVALLRAENALRNPWIQEILEIKFGSERLSILDIGCGGGFLTNFLAKKGHRVHGIDLSEKSLEIAKKRDETESVHYELASAYTPPFPDNYFDVVCAMDLLEHVQSPLTVIHQASRILKKGGVFFFHTFNRTLLSYFMIIKGVEWCFSNPPPNMHVYPLFLKPEELKRMCEKSGLKVEAVLGVRPDFSNGAFWKMVFMRLVDPGFRFTFTPSLQTGYSGYASKI